MRRDHSSWSATELGRIRCWTGRNGGRSEAHRPALLAYLLLCQAHPAGSQGVPADSQGVPAGIGGWDNRMSGERSGRRSA